MCENPWLWQTASEKCYLAHALRKVPGQIWRFPKIGGTFLGVPLIRTIVLESLLGSPNLGKLLRVTGRKGFSTQCTAVIISLFSVLARSEATYDMHFVPLQGVLLHQGSRKGHRLRPTGPSCSWYLDAPEIRTLLSLGHGWCCNGVLSNINVIILWAWMFW